MYNPVIVVLLTALVPAYIARRKGQSFWAFYVISLILTPLIGTICAICSKNLNKTAPARQTEKPSPADNAQPETPPPADNIRPETPSPADNAQPEKPWTCVCGQRVPEGTAACPACGRSRFDQQKKKMACPRCGADNVATDYACAACGEPLHGLVPTLDDLPERYKVRRIAAPDAGPGEEAADDAGQTGRCVEEPRPDEQEPGRSS